MTTYGFYVEAELNAAQFLVLANLMEDFEGFQKSALSILQANPLTYISPTHRTRIKFKEMTQK